MPLHIPTALIDYKASQYQGVYDLLTSLVNQETITNVDIEDSILTLENLGFDTLPFGVKLDDSLDSDSDEVHVAYGG